MDKYSPNIWYNKKTIYAQQVIKSDELNWIILG